MKELSICFPAYNEEKNIAYTLIEAVKELKKLNMSFEVVVINDGSKDGTESEIRKLMKKYPCIKLVNHVQNLGYAIATKSCLENASGKVIFIIDSDGQQTSRDIPKFLEKMDQGYNVVVGYKKQRHDPFLRIFLSKGYNLLFRLLFGGKLHDIDCGFRCFTKKIAQNVKINHVGVPVGPEIFAQILQMNLKIAEVVVTHLPRKSGKSIFNPWTLPKQISETLLSLIKLKLELKK